MEGSVSEPPDGSFDYPFSFDQFLSNMTTIVSATEVYFEPNTYAISQQLLFITNVTANASAPVIVGTFDPTDGTIDQSVTDYAIFTFDAAYDGPAITVSGSTNVQVYNLVLDHSSGATSRGTSAIVLEFDDATCSETETWVQYVTAVEGWDRCVWVKSPSPGNCGVNGLTFDHVTCEATLSGGLFIDGNTATSVNASVPQKYDHSNVFVETCTFTTTGNFNETALPTGVCAEVESVSGLEIYNSNFINCGINNGVNGTAPDFLTVEACTQVFLTWNLFNDLGGSPTGNIAGNNAMVIKTNTQWGKIDHNFFQSISGSAIVFEALSNGLSFGGNDNRYTSNWIVSFNLVEQAGYIFNRPPVYVHSIGGCSVLCFANLSFIHNTIYLNPPVPSSFEGLAFIEALSGTAPGITWVNNVLYLTNGTNATTSFLNYVTSQPGIKVVGNIFQRGDFSPFPLLSIGGQSYPAMADLRAAGFEVDPTNSQPAGGMYVVPNDIMVREETLPEPTPWIETYNPDTSEGTEPTALGDRINGAAIAVDVNGTALDPNFLCPGHEYPVFSTDNIPWYFIQAYQYQQGSTAVGRGVPLTNVYPTDIAENAGSTDIMLLPVQDDVRPHVVDSGCIRFVTPAVIMEDTTYSGFSNLTFVTITVATNATDIAFFDGTNATIARAFDLTYNSSLAVQNAIFVVQRGNATLGDYARLVAGPNATFSFGGRLTVPESALFSVNGASGCTVRNLMLFGNLSFASHSPPMVLESGHLSGTLVIVLTNRPIAVRGTGPATTTVTVATFPNRTVTAALNSVQVQGSYPSSACDVYTTRTVQSGTSLSVVVQVQPSPQAPSIPGCSQTTTSSGGLSGGAIAGIVLGCIFGSVLLVGGLVLWRYIVQKKKNEAGNAAIKSRSATDAERMRDQMERDEREEAERRRSREVPKAAQGQVNNTNHDLGDVERGTLDL